MIVLKPEKVAMFDFRTKEVYKQSAIKLSETMYEMSKILTSAKPFAYSLRTEADALEKLSRSAYKLLKLLENEMKPEQQEPPQSRSLPGT